MGFVSIFWTTSVQRVHGPHKNSLILVVFQWPRRTISSDRKQRLRLWRRKRRWNVQEHARLRENAYCLISKRGNSASEVSALESQKMSPVKPTMTMIKVRLSFPFLSSRWDPQYDYFFFWHRLETGTKRKNPPTSFSFSQDTVSSLAQKAEEEALKQIKAEQAEALKNKLPDFWLPSLTPTHTSGPPPQTLEDVQAQMENAKTVCRGAGEAAAHNLSYVIRCSVSTHIFVDVK